MLDRQRSIVRVRDFILIVSVSSNCVLNLENVRVIFCVDKQFGLYTMQEKLIRSFHGNSSGREVVRFGWDGTDLFNHNVASGLYPGVVLVNGRIVGRVTITR